MFKQISVKGSLGYAGDQKHVIELLGSGKLSVDDLVTAKVPLKDVVKGGLQALENEKDKHIKILIEIWFCWRNASSYLSTVELK